MKELTFSEYKKQFCQCDHEFALYHQTDAAGQNKYSCQCIYCGLRHPKAKMWIKKSTIPPHKLKRAIELTDYKKQLWQTRKDQIYQNYLLYKNKGV